MLATLAPAGAAAADVPAGPRLALMRWVGPGKFELLSVAADGRRIQVISSGSAERTLGAPAPFQSPAWSPNGKRIAFSGYDESDRLRIFIAAADGSGRRALPGTQKGVNPVFSPDGRTLAFARIRLTLPKIDPDDPLGGLGRGDGFHGVTTWLYDLTDGSVKRLTPWKDGLENVPSSFSPDGSFLAVSRGTRRGVNAVALPLKGDKEVVLARAATEPVYSPDGSQVAFVSFRDRHRIEGFDEMVSVSELYVRDLNEAEPRRLTFTAEHHESTPSWDPSGERLAYTQHTGSGEPGLGFSNVVMQINADGTCPQRVFGRPAGKGKRKDVALYGPAWQPGLGREAGRIAC